jgi:hypothetical protein
VELDNDSTILGVKEQLADGLALSAAETLRIVYQGKNLSDDTRTLDECHVRAGGLFVVISVKENGVPAFSRSDRGSLAAAVRERQLLCPGFIQSPAAVTLTWVPRGRWPLTEQSHSNEPYVYSHEPSVYPTNPRCTPTNPLCTPRNPLCSI